tara:strand:+ start:17841 stop:18131 length:291 start_codon:yes stop_codon:yes gene_type:complete
MKLLNKGDEIIVNGRIHGVELKLTYVDSFDGYIPGLYYTDYLFKYKDDYYIQTREISEGLKLNVKEFKCIQSKWIPDINEDSLSFLRDHNINDILK